MKNQPLYLWWLLEVSAWSDVGFGFAPVYNPPIAESSRDMLVISVPYYAFWLLDGHIAVEAHGGR